MAAWECEMAVSMNVNVTLRGPLFTKKIDATVKKVILEEGIERIGKEIIDKTERLKRSRKKGLGAKRNPVDRDTRGLTMTVTSQVGKWPRMSGGKWTYKNIGIIKGMAPRVMNKIAQRIVSELG
jgi:hypothetical protein